MSGADGSISVNAGSFSRDIVRKGRIAEGVSIRTDYRRLERGMYEGV